MPDNNQYVERFANKRYSEILSAGFSFFGKNWLKFLLPFASFSIISIIIVNLLTTDLTWQNILLTPQLEIILEKDIMTITDAEISLLLQYSSIGIAISLLDGIITTVINVFSMCIFSSYLYRKFIGESPSLFSEIKRALNPKLIIVLILLGISIPLGILLLYIPSILIYGFYAFLVFTYTLFKNENPIKKARILSKKFFWKIIGVFIINSLIISSISFVYQFFVSNILIIPDSWYNPVSRDVGLIILNDILYNIFEILLSPLFISLLCSLYVHLYFTRFQESIYGSRISIPTTEKKGIYCPFCGFYIIQIKQYCPSCGKKLDFEL